jgi:hypothetical protein
MGTESFKTAKACLESARDLQAAPPNRIEAAKKYDAIMDLHMVKLQGEDSTAQTTDTLKSTGSHSDEQTRSMVPQK